MAKVPVAVRLDPEALSSVDALAETRVCSRQSLMEAWILSGLEDSKGGVVDIPADSPTLSASDRVLAAAKAAGGHVRTARELVGADQVALDRQELLNQASARARSVRVQRGVRGPS